MSNELSPAAREARRRISRMGLATAAFFGATFAAQLLILALASLCGAPEALDGVYASWLLSLGTMYLVGLPVLLLVLRGVPAARPEPRRLRVRDFFVFFLVAYAASYLSNLIGSAIDSVIGGLLGATSSQTAVEMVKEAPLLLVIAIPVLFAPAVEELLFRRVLIDRLLPYGQGLSILVSAILFSVYHGNLVQSLYTFVIGLLLGYLYTATGRLRYCILLHMLYNFVGTVPALLLFRYVATPDELLLLVEQFIESGTLAPALLLGILAYGAYLLLVMAGVAAGAILFILHIRRVRLAPPAEPIPRAEWPRLFLSVGVLLLLLCFAALLVLSYLPG